MTELETAKMLLGSCREQRDLLAREVEDLRHELAGAPPNKIATRVWFTPKEDGLEAHFSFLKSTSADQAIELVRQMHAALGDQLSKAGLCPLHRT